MKNCQKYIINQLACFLSTFTYNILFLFSINGNSLKLYENREDFDTGVVFL